MRLHILLALILFLSQSSFLSAQKRYDICITEFIPDPSPAVGLPPASFIELKNCSSTGYNLQNWKLSNNSIAATCKTDYTLQPDSFLILCANSDTSAFRLFGRTLGFAGFPSLNNETGDIILYSAAGLVIHAIHYEKSWFKNGLKAAGGWSLEMMDPSKPWMGENNWSASLDPSGGTPGRKNSVDEVNQDPEAPGLIQAVSADSLRLILLFDKPLDSLSASQISNYSIQPGVGQPVKATGLAPFFERVELSLTQPLVAGKIYSVSVQNLIGCNGNEIGGQNHCKTGIALNAKANDIVFNEILFNPPTNGYDYLELYNRSSKIIRCNELYLAGKYITGTIKEPYLLTKADRCIFPGEYVLLTENADWVIQNYRQVEPLGIIQMNTLPSLPDDQGIIMLLNMSGETIDELDYDHHWHSALLANETGVSLERIQPDQPTNSLANWTSAATDAGFGTPTYKNSESSSDSSKLYYISAEPKIFSPDMDGYNDYCFIHYKMPAPGWMGSISIYDISGRM